MNDKIDPQAAERLLSELANLTHVRSAFLALRDGRPIAAIGTEADSAKIAAVLSSTVGLSTAGARELAIGSFDYVVVEGTEGRLVVRVLPEAGRLVVLGVVQAKGGNLGMLLAHLRKCTGAGLVKT